MPRFGKLTLSQRVYYLYNYFSELAINSSRLGVVRCTSSFVGWPVGLFFLASRKAAQSSSAATPIVAKQRTQSLYLRNLRALRNAGRPGGDVRFCSVRKA